MNQVENLKQLMTEVETNAIDFYGKENKAAARRARKALQEIAKICKTFRKDITDKVNELKTK